MADLVAWLTKILDEDEKTARVEADYAAGYHKQKFVEYQWVRFVRATPDGAVQATQFGLGVPSPPAVLADIAAKRAILKLHQPSAIRPVVNDTLRLLASAYAARPGYDEAWRP